MVRALVGVALVVCLAGACGEETCETPPAFAYDCEPQAESANACVGGPVIDGVQRDPDKNYPIGCFAGVPTCVGGELEVAHDCECVSGFAGTDWACSQ